MLPTLKGKKQQKHEYLYWEFFEQGGKQAIRKDSWKAIRLDMSIDPDVPILLFDLNDDISEENDLSAENPQLTTEFAQLMKDARIPSDDFKFRYEEEDHTE
jgi:hypothetical protein